MSTPTIDLTPISEVAAMSNPDCLRGLLVADAIVARLLPEILNRVREAYPTGTPLRVIPHPAQGDANPAITIQVHVPRPNASTFDPLDDVLSGYNHQLHGSETILLPGVDGL